MSFINPIIDLNLTESIDSNYRSAISKNNGILKDYFTNFLTNIQIKIESGQSIDFTIEESEFLMNLLTNIIDNGMLNGNEKMTCDDDAYSSVLDAYVSFDTYRQAFTKIVTQVILNHMFVKTDGYTSKTIRRRNLTEYEQHLLNIFTEADNRGRIS